MIDEHAATELKLYIDNDGDLYRRQTTSILKNLATKKVRSQYKHDLAVKLFGYLVEAGAKKYVKEFGGPPAWHKQFDVPTRKAVAEELTRDFEGEFELGNYDDLLPKKYQKEMLGKKFPRTSVRAHARKKPSSSRSHHSTISASDIREFRGFLRNATDRQIQGIYDKEKRAGRDEYAELAIAEALRRGLVLESNGDLHWEQFLDDDRPSRYHSTKKKPPAQLDREIAAALGKQRNS